MCTPVFLLPREKEAELAFAASTPPTHTHTHTQTGYMSHQSLLVGLNSKSQASEETLHVSSASGKPNNLL